VGERHLEVAGDVLARVLAHIAHDARVRVRRVGWKFSSADIREGEHWDDQQAIAAVLLHTSTEWAPRHVVPADH
jgi:polyphosphate kinase 2 (PPK2 family)